MLGLTEMGAIKSQLAEEADADRRAMQNSVTPAAPAAEMTAPALERSSLFKRIIREFGVSSACAQAATRQDEMSVTLQPGEGTEVKLIISKGAETNVSWTASGGVVNFDKLGDGGGESISYEKGRAAAEDRGVLEAAFTGNHGWFWRNRTSVPVTVTLRTDGPYADIKRMM